MAVWALSAGFDLSFCFCRFGCLSVGFGVLSAGFPKKEENGKINIKIPSKGSPSCALKILTYVVTFTVLLVVALGVRVAFEGTLKSLLSGAV